MLHLVPTSIVRVTQDTTLAVKPGRRIVLCETQYLDITLTLSTYVLGGMLYVMKLDSSNTLSIALASGETLNGFAPGTITLTGVVGAVFIAGTSGWLMPDWIIIE